MASMQGSTIHSLEELAGESVLCSKAVSMCCGMTCQLAVLLLALDALLIKGFCGAAHACSRFPRAPVFAVGYSLVRHDGGCCVVLWCAVLCYHSQPASAGLCTLPPAVPACCTSLHPDSISLPHVVLVLTPACPVYPVRVPCLLIRVVCS